MTASPVGTPTGRGLLPWSVRESGAMQPPLWAPWRMEYIVGAKPDACVFCEMTKVGEDRLKELLVLVRQPHAFVCLNRYPFASGHLLVTPRRHDSSEGELELGVDLGDRLGEATLVADQADGVGRRSHRSSLSVAVAGGGSPPTPDACASTGTPTGANLLKHTGRPAR